MRAYKYRIYPNEAQKELIAKHFGCTRFVYNWGLENKIRVYQQDKKTLSCFDLINKLKELKSENEWYGTQIVKMGRFEPSSKMCSCGEINHELTLADRVWTCKKCGKTHDRDLLASQNILKFGMKLISGRDYRRKPVELPTLAGAMKQEAVKLV